MQRTFSVSKATFISYTLLLALPFIIFWPLWLHPEAMAYDMADYFLPFRHFIGECLQEHQFPWWNPYSGLGIPLAADPQSGVFYPVTWLIGYLAGYDFVTINIEYLLHLSLAGWGMFMLLRGMHYALFSSLLLAIAYQFSGFMVNNAQHLTWIISACWLPYFLHHYRLTFLTGDRNHAIKTVLSLFLFTTGGYPAFLIILCYLVAGHILFVLIHNARIRQPAQIRHVAKWSAVMLIIYLVITAPFIYSFLQGVPLMTRGEPLSKDHTLFLAFTPQSAITFLLPATPLGRHVDFETDISMTNVYMGLLTWIFLIAGLTFTREKRTMAVILCTLTLLLISFGDVLPFWTFLFDYVPYFDHIRFPAAFRLFVITGCLVIAAEGMKQETIRPSRLPGFIAGSSALLILTILIVAYNLLDQLLWPGSFSTAAMLQFFGAGSTLNTMALQSMIQLPLLIIAGILFFSRIRRNKSAWQIMVLMFVLVDLFIASRINFPVIIGSEFPAGELNKKLSSMPSGFPMWNADTETEVSGTGNGSFAPSYFNNNLFEKKFSRDSYAPFMLKQRALLERSPVKYALLDHPVMYFTDQLQSYPDPMDDRVKLHEKNTVLVPDILVKQFEGLPGDSLISQIQLTGFSATQFGVHARTSKQALLILQQTYYPGWKVKVNQVIEDPLVVNYCMMSVVLPAGDHQVSFFFDKTYPEAALLLSTSMCILLLLLIFFGRKRSGSGNHLNLRP